MYPCPREEQQANLIITTQESSRLAFNKRGRSLQASDLTDEVHTAFLNIFGEEDPDAGGQKL